MKIKYLPPVILQIAGLVLLVAFVVIWVLTKQESVLLVGAAMTLIGTGTVDSMRNKAREEIESLRIEPTREAVVERGSE